MANNNIVITAVIIMIVLMLIDSKPGINFNPSTAESIDIAGVITPSPRSKETPIYPRKDMKPTFLPFLSVVTRISLRTIIPPSPLVLILIANQAY